MGCGVFFGSFGFSSSSVPSSSSSSVVSLVKVAPLYIFNSNFLCSSFLMVFSVRVGGGVGLGIAMVGVSLSCWVDSSMFLTVSKSRNNGYSLKLFMRNVAKSSGFSFEDIYLSASGWTNVP